MAESNGRGSETSIPGMPGLPDRRPQSCRPYMTSAAMISSAPRTPMTAVKRRDTLRFYAGPADRTRVTLCSEGEQGALRTWLAAFPYAQRQEVRHDMPFRLTRAVRPALLAVSPARLGADSSQSAASPHRAAAGHEADRPVRSAVRADDAESGDTGCAGGERHPPGASAGQSVRLAVREAALHQRAGTDGAHRVRAADLGARAGRRAADRKSVV